MAWAFLQEVHRTSGNASTQAGVQFSSVTVAGDALFAVASWGGGAGSTFFDSNGDVFTVRKEVNDATNGVSLSVGTAFNIAGGTLSSVSCSFVSTASSQFAVIGVAEYSGLSAFDIAVGQSASGSTAANNITSTQATPTGSSGALLFGAMVDVNGVSTNTITAGTGYTIRANTVYTGGVSAIVYEDQKQASTGSTSARFTQKQAHSYICSMVAADISVGGGSATAAPWTMMLTGLQ